MGITIYSLKKSNWSDFFHLIYCVGEGVGRELTNNLMFDQGHVVKLFYKRDHLIGAVSYKFNPRVRECHINHWIMNDSWGRGIHLEALESFVTHINNKLHCKGITIQVSKQNQKELEYYKDAGFFIEGEEDGSFTLKKIMETPQPKEVTIRMAKMAEQQYILSLSGKVMVESTIGRVQAENLQKAMEAIMPAIQAGAYHLVAIVEGRLAGWLLVGSNIDYLTNEEVGFLVDLYVFKEYRNQGIGHRLLLKGMDVLKKNGYHVVQLNVYGGNPAKAVYEELGFMDESTLMTRSM